MVALMPSITVTVAKVNGTGFTSEEEPRRLFNLSKFQDPAPVIPPAGTVCRVTVNGAGFVRAIEPVTFEPSASGVTPCEHTPGEHTPATRDTVITRLT
jgi:hypothetical protein